MYITKKQLTEIKHISIYDKVLKHYNFNFINNPPEMWKEDERLLFDILTELEYQIHKRINDIIGEQK